MIKRLSIRLFTHIRLPAGRHLIHEASRAVSCSSCVPVTSSCVAADDERTPGMGDVVGEIALFEAATRNADVVADGSVDVLVQGTREFEEMLYRAPAVATRLEEVARRRTLASRSGDSGGDEVAVR
jgi:CRP-like cAMP-binding protein